MSNFNYYLNRQGSRGRQGIQGIQGFSPVITVATNTLSEYILHIVTQDNEFDTVNLREHKEDLGGTYIRYNRETGVMYAGDVDVASPSQIGVVRFATAAEVTAGDVEEAVTSVANVTDMINAKGYDEAIARVQDNLDAAVLNIEADISAETLARQAADGVLQSSINNLRNSLVNYVDLTSNQTINGVKRFNYLRANAVTSLYNAHTMISYDESNNKLKFGGASTSSVEVNRGGDTYINIDTGNLDDYVDVDIATTQTAGIVKPDGTTITVEADGTIHGASTYVLPTASTTTLGGVKIDGQTITIDQNGVISSAAGGAEIDDNHMSLTTTYSSMKIEGRLGEVQAIAEDNIDGGAIISTACSIVMTIDGDDYTNTATRSGFTGSQVQLSNSQTINNIEYRVDATFTLGSPRHCAYRVAMIQNGVPIYETDVITDNLPADYTVTATFN